MTTLREVLRLAHAALVIGLLAHSNIASAQVDIPPGKSMGEVFTKRGEKHRYTVGMRAGERLLLHIESVGQILRTTFRVLDPIGTRIGEHEGIHFSDRHDFQSPVLSASGPYLIEVRNARGVGEYTISVDRIDRSGNEIPPGSRGPEGSREP
jgi:hypothetical protein